MPEFKDKVEEEEFHEVYAYGPDRARAIVLVAILENRIDYVFQSLLRKDKNVYRELFQSSGPLGDLGTKVRLLYMLNILRKGIFNDLMAFIKIRNKFAHEPSIRTFDDQPVCDYVRNLTTWKTFRDAHDALRTAAPEDVTKQVMKNIYGDSLTSPREMFKLAVRIYIGYLEELAPLPEASSEK